MSLQVWTPATMSGIACIIMMSHNMDQTLVPNSVVQSLLGLYDDLHASGHLVSISHMDSDERLPHGPQFQPDLLQTDVFCQSLGPSFGETNISNGVLGDWIWILACAVPNFTKDWFRGLGDLAKPLVSSMWLPGVLLSDCCLSAVYLLHSQRLSFAKGGTRAVEHDALWICARIRRCLSICVGRGGP